MMLSSVAIQYRRNDIRPDIRSGLT